MTALPDGTVTFLFTDIEGSTRLLHELGNGYADVLTDHRRLLRDAFRQHGGREVDTQGDSFFVAFANADDAVGAAAAAQRALAAHPWPAKTEVRVRMGVHTGEPMIVGEHYVGIDVHRAARIAAAASGGQVLISARTSALLQENGAAAKATLRELGAYPLKDLPEPERLFQLIVDGLPASFPPLRVDKEAPAAAGLPDYSLPPADVPCPYKGLVRFEAEDSDLFFGREELVSELANRLEDSAFLAVVGPSGSGKSSLVRAGVVPELERRKVSVRPAIIEPGEHPVPQLARTQGADLVVIDQFEEVFTLCRDEEERLVFIDRVLDAAESGARVVLMLRADFYGHCASYGRLAAALEDGQALIGPMTEEELRRAIERPAERAGLVLEPGLPEGILRDIVGEPGALPLLSHSLLETWRRRSDRMLTLLGYLQSGGVRGAIAKTAETVYREALTSGQQTLARNIFMRLTELGEGTEDTRRRVRVDELTPRQEQAADVQEVLSVLVDARLVTTDEGTVEVAHEALIRHWPTLRGWLDDDREGRLVHRRLTEAAQEWEGLGRDSGALYRGTRLGAALGWAEQHDDELNELEREFLRTGREAEIGEIDATKRRNRRLRVLVAALAVLLVGAVGAGVFALVQRSDARTKARVALARELGAQAVSEPRIDRAMLLAREAVALDDSPRTAGTLLATLLRSPAAIGTFSSPITDRPQRIALSPDGKTLAVVENTDLARFVDTRTHREWHAPLPNTVHIAPAYSRSGDLAVLMRSPSETTPPAIDVRDGGTLRHLRFLPLGKRWLSTPTSFQNPLFVSPDERTAYMAYSLVDPDNQTDGPAYVDRWDIRSGKLLGTTALGSNGMFGGRISGGKLLLLTDSELVTLDANTLRRLSATPVRVPADSFTDLASVSPDGATIAVASQTGAVSFVDVRSGHTTVGAGKGGSPLQAVEFPPSGDVAVTTNESGQVTLWDPKSANVIVTFTGHEDRTLGIAFSADGSTLYTCSLDGAIFEWDLAGKRRFGHPFEIPGMAAVADDPDVPLFPPLALSPDGSRFATRNGRNAVEILSTDTLRPVRSFTVAIGGPITDVAWSPARAELAISGLQGRVQLWSVSGRPRLVRSLQGIAPVTKLTETVNAVAFSPSGDLVAAVATNQSPGQNPPVGLVGVWEASTGRLLWKRVDRRGSAVALAFARDGKRLALSFDAGRKGGVVQIVDPKTGRVERTLRPIGFGHTLGFSPDGTLATGADSGIVQRWDVSSGAQLGHSILALPAPVASISFDPSGATFATGGGSGGFVKLWDTQTLQQLGSAFPGSPGKWANGQFTRDGSKLVTLYQDGRGTVWPATVEAWKDHACRMAGRNFTREEWSRFVTGRGYARVCPGYPASQADR
jgi:WD40 repeat protein/class 3 adenylate cyclase